MIQIKNNLKNKKNTKGNLMSRVFLACKKVTAMFCAIGLVMIMNTPLVSAYEAHTVNVTARIVNNIPCIDPPGGEFCSSGEFKVELSVTLAEADIYYTTDGTNPICGVNKYNAPFELSDNAITTVKAVACHNMIRNGGQVLIQSATMEKVFDISAPSVNVSKPEDKDVWYCSPSNPITYSVEWAVENYRGAASELDIDIVYIIDDSNDDDNYGVIDDGDTRFDNLPRTTDLTGEDTNYQFELIQEYCYYGYGWMKIIATEPNDCSGFGISGRIFDPMLLPADDSCDNPIPAPVSDNIPVVPEPEPIINPTVNNDDSGDIFDNADNTSDDNSSDNGDLDSEDTNEDNVSEENIEEDDTSEDIRDESGEEDANDNIDADDLDLLNENSESGEENLNDETEDSDAGLNNEDDSIDNKEEDSQENGIVIDREEDFDEEEDSNNDDDDSDESEDDDDTVVDSNDSPINDISDDTDSESIDDDSDSDDSDGADNSPDDAPIEADNDSTEVSFSL